MRCLKCGYNNLEGLKYCSSCGEELLTEEEYNLKIRESNREVRKLYGLVALLVVVLIFVGTFFIINSTTKRTVEVEDTSNISTNLVGTWYCKNSERDENYSVEFELSSNMSFKFGVYEKIESNGLRGAYTSKDIGPYTEDLNYEVYMVKMEVSEIRHDGQSTTEGASLIQYIFLLNSDKKYAIVSLADENGNPSRNGTMYCDRINNKKKEDSKKEAKDISEKSKEEKK